ncbi:uncharacterized protein J3D65DRAFT_310960 [Phyllosticta citribraziliensis]|uniref:Uncharacterized protein n=1 Tax=Phyllosticta citribraziliensis TaxID=989973 RepID=A0ABR1LY29_9PEZI
MAGVHKTLEHCLDTKMEWQVQGEWAVVQWLDEETGMEQYLGRLGDGSGGRLGSETPFVLWIGHDVDNVSRKLVLLNLHLKLRSSTSKPKKDVLLVLPVTKAAVNAQPASRAHSNPALSIDCIRVTLSLNEFPYTIMPQSRRRVQRPLDDVPGYLIECVRKLTTTKTVHVYVAKSEKLDGVLQDVVAAAHRGSLHDAALDLNVSGGHDELLVNRWDLYPVTTDDLGPEKARCWNPYVDEQPPPEYTQAPCVGLGLQPPETAVGASPDEVLGWAVCSPPKRKASASPVPPWERITKARLEKATQATEPIGTAEMLDLARQDEARRDATAASSLAASPSTTGTGQRYEDIVTFSFPTLRAPSTEMPISSIWRLQFSKTNSIFFDMVALLQKALKRQPNTHEMHLSRFLALGHAARKAVAALTQQDGTTTPDQDSTYAAFVAMREELARRVIADMAVDLDTVNKSSPSPFPLNPLDQVEYLRHWMNERVQVFADTDVLEELGAMRAAAAKLLERHPLGAYSSDVDPVGCEFEWARAAVLAAIFFNVGNQPLMAGREERSPVMWGKGYA